MLVIGLPPRSNGTLSGSWWFRAKATRSLDVIASILLLSQGIVY